MSSVRQNKIVTITNDETYDLAGHQARMADATNVVILVSSQAERDGFTKYIGLTVRRMDVTGHPLEEWNGTTWDRQPVVTHSTLNNDGFWSITGGLVKTVLPSYSYVEMIATLVRTGANITINTTDSALLNGMIPAGFRPGSNHYWTGVVNTALAGARYAEPQFIIGDTSNGNLVARSTSGGPVTVNTSYAMFLNAAWYL